MNRCKAYTRQSRKCKKHTFYDSKDFCYFHFKQLSTKKDSQGVNDVVGVKSECKKQRCLAYVEQRKDVWTGRAKKPRRCRKNGKDGSHFCHIHLKQDE